MSITVPTGETDDLGFIELVNHVIAQLLGGFAPEEVWVIEVQNWFDHKWLRYSGKAIVDFPWPVPGVAALGALDAKWQDRLTFPPFSPHRVLRQSAYLRSDDDYQQARLKMKPHPRKWQHSEENLHRRVRHFTWSGAFFWYSSNTTSNGRGSLMVYTVRRGGTACWFAEFVRHEEWRLHETKGIGRGEVQQLLQTQLV